MKISKLTALLAAAACIGCFTGCGKKSEKNSSENKTANDTSTAAAVEATAPVVGGDELSADKYNEEKYLDKINEKIKDAKVSDKTVELGSVGDLVTPAEGTEEYELGDYRISDNGIKLYYDDKEFSDELMLSLAEYFTAVSAADYETYSSFILPSYIEEMESFLKENYDYDHKTSFAKRCSSFATQMNGDYRITRIKLEAAEPHEDGKDNIDDFLESLDEVFGDKYSERVKSESDELINAAFYVMAEDSTGKETVLISDYEIVFAVKDGKYYTFG